MDDRTRWNERYLAGQGPDQVNPRLKKYLHLLKRGRALDLAGGIGQNAILLSEWNVVLCDISDAALTRAPSQLARVQADALELPFPDSTFDTIICTYFTESRVDYAGLLTPSGTLFLETHTVADMTYRPDFNKAYRLNLADIGTMLPGMKILLSEENDDGHRVFGTVIAQARQLLA